MACLWTLARPRSSNRLLLEVLHQQGQIRKGQKNFNEQEDQLLVSAWLNISTDPVQGTNQTKGSFWTRVYDYYHSNKEFTSDRSQSSLLHRWKGILENVNKFCGCVTRIEGRNQSGITFQDKLIQTLALFKAEDNFNSCTAGISCEINQSGMRSGSKWHLRSNLVTKNKRQT